MLFNSIDFLFFFLIAFSCYWLIPSQKRKLQNLFLLSSSYIFYGFWDARFLILIASSSFVDYLIGQKLHATDNKRQKKHLLWTSLAFNIGVLFLFKYFNFFIDSFAQLITFLGFRSNISSLNLILPVGISFYTFQTLSYTIDIYNKKIKPTNDLIEFFAFVSFFPQLVAGPIERASNLLPQFQKNRHFDYALAVDGCKQTLWGFFKKIVIADSVAPQVNYIFENYADLSAPHLLIGAVLFAFQIYGDFSGYSDIAIGISKLLGFKLMKNFDFPYFSRDIAEFWRKWHISLTSWFRDYLYIPLGGSRLSTIISIRNVFIIFLVSGLWHGANWTFIAWGGINAILFLPLFISEKNRTHINLIAKNRFFPSLRELVLILITFFLICITWIFFRAETITDALIYLKTLFLMVNSVEENLHTFYLTSLLLILFLLIIEWSNREKEHGLAINWKNYFSWPLYTLLLFCILYFYKIEAPNEFIYFQF